MDRTASLEALERAAERGSSGRIREDVSSLTAFLASELDEVAAVLPETLPLTVHPLAETGRHLIEAGGKRLRPMLVLLAAHLAGTRGEEAIKLACSGELVHLATLLHDDVVDEGLVRRGRPAPRMVWSNTASVLGGDYALTRALDLVASVPSQAPLKEAISTLRLLVEGEMLQLQHRHTPEPTEAAYLEVAERKTASLFIWCCRAPVHLTDNPALLEAMTTFGRSLGLCFQMVDDILDLEADEATLGKQLLVDLAGGKATLPVILGMERDPSLRQAWLRLAEQQTANEESSEAAFAFAHAVRASGGIEAARERARGEAAEARRALLRLPDSEARAHLLTMTDGLVARIR